MREFIQKLAKWALHEHQFTVVRIDKHVFTAVGDDFKEHIAWAKHTVLCTECGATKTYKFNFKD